RTGRALRCPRSGHRWRCSRPGPSMTAAGGHSQGPASNASPCQDCAAATFSAPNTYTHVGTLPDSEPRIARKILSKRVGNDKLFGHRVKRPHDVDEFPPATVFAENVTRSINSKSV